jgi:hypothetical protein
MFRHNELGQINIDSNNVFLILPNFKKTLNHASNFKLIRLIGTYLI